MSSTVPALRALGVDARAWEFGQAPLAYNSLEGVRFIRMPRRREYLRAAYVLASFLRIAYWADVIHWYCKPTGFLPVGIDTHVFRRLRKPGVVEWRGSDIRNPDVERADNPVWRQYESAPDVDLRPYGASERSRLMQEAFANLGFHTVVPPGMLQYVLPELSDRTHVVQRALDSSRISPEYPVPDSANPPLVVHAPSSMAVKGTQEVVKALAPLEEAGQIRFELITGMPRKEALCRIAACDIFVDQLVLGDYGVAAMEAMALGKPVVCYLKPAIVEVYPRSLPIVNASPDDLAIILSALAFDGPRRHRLGREGREYAERHHSPALRASRLRQIYDSLLV